MNNIINVLNSSFNIEQIIIENFTVLDKKIKIFIKINSIDFGITMLAFQDVSAIHIDSEYYACSKQPSIVIEDISNAQMQGIKYKVAISEDVMTFYCQTITLDSR